MTHYFLDSSALIKRYIAEQGTVWIRAISLPSAGNTIIVAPVTQVEVFSGVSRRKREGVVADRTAQAIRLLLNRHIKHEYMVIKLTPPLIQIAQNLLDKHPLRAYDAIQLASALVANNRLITTAFMPLAFVSADTRLLNAATAEGLTFDDPNAHP
ncbi:MAG: type II toxin-antitoxin system VapC family toxin [Chloroflexota bacterium]